MGPVRLRIVVAQLETVAEPSAHFVICKQSPATSAPLTIALYAVSPLTNGERRASANCDPFN